MNMLGSNFRCDFSIIDLYSWQDIIFMENTPGYDESLLEKELGAWLEITSECIVKMKVSRGYSCDVFKGAFGGSWTCLGRVLGGLGKSGGPKKAIHSG